ncbi:MAG TPA: dTDP-4-dehydrorhamnose 3,5-epimerase family protein [Candidatus Limnocylindrales bacterium]|nr:dTDP-4-dehydrorhamnose 3,5-epimerase family protein [Candidatus Limnocylindrales bacterium]
MIFVATPLAGVVLVEAEPHRDERGSFARLWCAEEFARAGLDGRFVQSSISTNARKHTVRGLHYAAAPSREAKLVRVTAGAVFDVVVDLREESPTYGETFAAELDAASVRALYVPPGCAHGFQTLADATDVLYCMTEAYEASLARAYHWRSPQLAIRWPSTGAGVTISDADANAVTFERRATPRRGAAPRSG